MLMNQKLFFLGGYDLEMLEIKKILDSLHVRYEDKKLTWGAKLSEYQEFFDSDSNIYGIELEEDITPPANYTAIDHHGKNDHLASSLEQVAKLFNIKLTKEQKLIAANDSRYISGMRSLCATKAEIDEIRVKDRKVQGITQEDEEKARLSVEKANSNIIFSQIPYFTCISDLVYDKYDKYIIYDDTKIIFYGYNLGYIEKFLNSFGMTQESYYSGGGEFGFLGVRDDVLTKEKIQALIKEFNGMQAKNQTISHHVFMLPFKYKDKQSVIKNLEKPQETVSYNEQAYFHDFFIQSMYENCQMYESREFKKFTLQTKDLYDNNEQTQVRKASKTYELNVEKVLLRVFEDFNVAILSFHLDNTKYSDTQAILEINDYARRIYPEYLDEEFQCELVPSSVSLDQSKESFNYEQTDTSPKLSKIITDIVGENITPAVDDRMFTISYFLNEKMVDEVQKDYLCHDKWYEYVFVDGDGKTVQNQEMQQQLIKDATYNRWQGYGTMYGISRYSFVCLTNSDFPLAHIKSMYFSMFSLLLMVRATLLKFADDISKSAQDIDKDIDKDISKNVSTLYKDYIKFINKYYFREITAKDQGAELYEKALETLKIQRDIKDLDEEIEELHKFVELQSEKRSADSMNLLTLIGSILLLPSLVTGYFGMNGLSESVKHFQYKPELLIASALVIPIIIFIKKIRNLVILIIIFIKKFVIRREK